MQKGGKRFVCFSVGKALEFAEFVQKWGTLAFSETRQIKWDR